MKKNKKNSFFDFEVVLFFYVFGSLFLSFVIVGKLDFISHHSFCLSNPIFLCDIPILGRVVKILDTEFLLAIFFWLLLILLFYIVSIRLGFKSKIDEVLNYQEIKTKKDKENWKKYQIYIFLVTFVVVIILLIVFD
tara:strand:+ start:377 stop:784 length:408 start_codon:yes stop_codon:yes gene_type:complete